MQILYADSCRSDQGDLEILKKDLKEKVDASYRLFLYNVLFLYEFSKSSVKDDSRRKKKHIPSEIDKIFKPVLFDNPLIASIRDDRLLQKDFEDHNLKYLIDPDQVKKCYVDFCKEDEYLHFLRSYNSDDSAYTQVLLEAYKFILKHEIFQEGLNDRFHFWKADKSLILGTMKKYIKSLPGSEGEHRDFQPDDELVKEFAGFLLENTLKYDDQNTERLREALQNWDMDRVAKLDLILLKMALTELVSFPTIPSKVTINEYVEISKNYSTDKSKEFLNGILDRLMKKFTQEGIVVKEGRGLREE
jgi:N utilization substance protein B